MSYNLASLFSLNQSVPFPHCMVPISRGVGGRMLFRHGGAWVTMCGDGWEREDGGEQKRKLGGGGGVQRGREKKKEVTGGSNALH